MSLDRAAVIILFACGATAQAGDLMLDPKQSELVVKTTKEGLAKGFAHNHVVRATAVTGTLSWDPAAPQASRVTIAVAAASLSVDDPAVRKRYGEATSLDEKDRQKVTEAMLGDQQLDVKRYPAITFTSSGARLDAGKLVLTGQLTLHGVTKTLRLPVTITQRGEAVVGEGRLRLRTSDFGIEPFSTALGTIRNSDEVELFIRIVGTPAGPVRGS